MSTSDWRISLDKPLDGPLNMAVDQAILEAVAAGAVLPTLRLYAWWPACLSLGYAQRSGEADLARLSGLGWGVVRRATGGRAILHVDELTYSICAPVGDEPVTGDVLASYRRLSTALLTGLERLGLKAQAGRRLESPNGAKSPVCFETPSDYEITVGGRKLIGSAQVRRQGVVLQHGSLPLTGDVGRICEGLIFPDEAAREVARQRVRERATTLERALGRPVSWDEAARAVMDAFAATLDVRFVNAEAPQLLEAEWRRAQALREAQYATDTWNRRR